MCDGNAFVLLLKEDGSIAWLTEDGRFNIQTELHAVDKKGSRILAAGETDEGTGINPRSLVLGEGVLYWMQGNKPATAPLD
jgi:flagellar basal body rod protein FlgG